MEKREEKEKEEKEETEAERGGGGDQQNESMVIMTRMHPSWDQATVFLMPKVEGTLCFPPPLPGSYAHPAVRLAFASASASSPSSPLLHTSCRLWS